MLINLLTNLRIEISKPHQQKNCFRMFIIVRFIRILLHHSKSAPLWIKFQKRENSLCQNYHWSHTPFAISIEFESLNQFAISVESLTTKGKRINLFQSSNKHRVEPFLKKINKNIDCHNNVILHVVKKLDNLKNISFWWIPILYIQLNIPHHVLALI